MSSKAWLVYCLHRGPSQRAMARGDRVAQMCGGDALPARAPIHETVVTILDEPLQITIQNPGCWTTALEGEEVDDWPRVRLARS